MKRYIVVGILIAISFGLLSATLLSAQETDTSDPVTVYNVVLTEYMVHVEDMEEGAPLTFEVGKTYEINFRNEGTIEHEILMGQNALVTDTEHNYHLDFETNLLDDVEMAIKGEMNGEEFAIGITGLIEFEVKPGQALTLNFILPEGKAGEWELACFVSSDPNATEEHPGLTHFDLGMKLPIVVTEAAN